MKEVNLFIQFNYFVIDQYWFYLYNLYYVIFIDNYCHLMTTQNIQKIAYFLLSKLNQEYENAGQNNKQRFRS